MPDPREQDERLSAAIGVVLIVAQLGVVIWLVGMGLWW